jgi:hypothetical protein
MNVSEGNVIPTFLTVAAEDTEPFEPKTIHEAKKDTSWPEWERVMLEEVASLKEGPSDIALIHKLLRIFISAWPRSRGYFSLRN